ncbi:hypothetical protein [Marinivivus vitaminiproducens]|uniref:hypothetical protein n=1 Tax=Marinivivus vitaminiproducens TaxID=3035935 RepID=UPI0027A0C909|nr:hypothetical protein P4R82_12505 [Geminicoccaceae bacterium SCSIO 64248]
MNVRPDRRLFLTGLAAAGLSLALPRRAARARQQGGAIYQRLWDLDQAGNGIEPLHPGARGDPDRGYVVVDEMGDGGDHVLFPEVVLPAAKRRTYDLATAIFPYYRLDQTKDERPTEATAQAMLALLEAVADTEVMAAAALTVGRMTGRDTRGEAWLRLLFDVWFRPFDMGRNRDLSGFEHVVRGEQKQAALSGQHWWYAYAQADDPDGPDGDRIRYDGLRYARRISSEGLPTPPEVVTLSYRWDALDAETGQSRPLGQEIGGFFVGCSIEGLMALGTVSFFQPDRPEPFTLGDGRYQMDLYRSPDGQSLRTFYPVYLGRV